MSKSHQWHQKWEQLKVCISSLDGRCWYLFCFIKIQKGETIFGIGIQISNPNREEKKKILKNKNNVDKELRMPKKKNLFMVGQSRDIISCFHFLKEVAVAKFWHKWVHCIMWTNISGKFPACQYIIHTCYIHLDWTCPKFRTSIIIFWIQAIV